jgi:hypothetical protein
VVVDRLQVRQFAQVYERGVRTLKHSAQIAEHLLVCLRSLR